MRAIILVLCLLTALPVWAETPDLKGIVERHVVPRYQTLADEATDLADAASQDCSAESVDLLAAYHETFDAWVAVSHLRFGPSEVGDRAFAIAFWPDPRGSTPKALAALIRAEDPAVFDREEFADVSVAARGLYALEFLLFDAQFSDAEKGDYHCALVKALTADISASTNAILAGWQDGYADLMARPGNDTYRTATEAAQQLFTSLSTGLEFTANTRLGRPMGTFERPRPKRAEAWRSGRSLRHVVLSLKSTRDLAALISMKDPEVAEAFEAAIAKAEGLNDPVFASIANPQERIRVEALQQSINTIRQLLAEKVGPSLGIAAGFNALDGD